MAKDISSLDTIMSKIEDLANYMEKNLEKAD